MSEQENEEAKLPKRDQLKYAYDSLLSIRGTEFSVFAQRANLVFFVQAGMLALVGQLFVASGGSSLPGKTPLLAVLVLIGLVLGFDGFFLVRGLVFWIRHYETLLIEVESDLLPDVTVFKDHPSYREQKPPGYSSVHAAFKYFSVILLAAWVLLAAFLIVTWILSETRVT